ncbi:unnamed protein product [Hymenolepis diminuta]|uniref:Uridylate-specific endoribonuclease n=1 Tax=Hymenolepis diminuta TaxID=6216 RepID=A0A564ZAY4_HYMDI|nr:unnamed protein product [Hymenolepis diminuta]
MQLAVLVLVFVSYVQCYGEKPQEDIELSRVVSDAWINDPNRLKVGQDLLLNWQGQISDRSDSKDISSAPLCTIKSTKLNQDPVYKAFIALLNNYEHRVGFSESETEKEKEEIDQFLDAVIKTKTMENFHNYLIKQKLASAPSATFKKELYDLWFKTYRRVRQSDSSPFEHVFVGETKQNNVLGMHNWITFCINEKNGVFNYYGHSKPHYLNPDYKASLQFSMHRNFVKPFGTILFGSSVEFDFGLYTAVFLRSQQLFKDQQRWPALVVHLDKTRILVQCHQFAGNRIGSCYVK